MFLIVTLSILIGMLLVVFCISLVQKQRAGLCMAAIAIGFNILALYLNISRYVGL